MSKKVQVKQLTAVEEFQQIRNDMFLRFHIALTFLKRKSVLLDTWNGIMTDIYFPEFNYNCSPNCKDELLLNFKDEDENILGLSVKLQDIEDINIDDNLDEYGEFYEGETKYYCECVRIDLFNEQLIRLELQW